ncbi:MAG: hypothetical protein WDL87_02065 [Candidatus Omnitrophota bacterium]|jgi:hypothetical protein
MDTDIKREHGEQPLGKVMAAYGLKPHDLVSSSTEQLSHKMVARAIKGRRLTPHMQFKIIHALNKATKKHYELSDLFNY